MAAATAAAFASFMDEREPGGVARHGGRAFAHVKLLRSIGKFYVNGMKVNGVPARGLAKARHSGKKVVERHIAATRPGHEKTATGKARKRGLGLH